MMSEKFCATGYASTKDETSEKYVVDVANSAQVSTNKDESGNVTATVDGNYSGGETSREWRQRQHLHRQFRQGYD